MSCRALRTTTTTTTTCHSTSRQYNYRLSGVELDGGGGGASLFNRLISIKYAPCRFGHLRLVRRRQCAHHDLVHVRSRRPLLGQDDSLPAKYERGRNEISLQTVGDTQAQLEAKVFIHTFMHRYVYSYIPPPRKSRFAGLWAAYSRLTYDLYITRSRAHCSV